MAAETKAEDKQTKEITAYYVYGIVPDDVELTPDAVGIGDPPAEVRLVREGEVAALVSEIDPSQPVGTPEDLRAHADLLDAAATTAPVLPMRFGSVLMNEGAVRDELLAPYHQEFADALAQLEGRVQFTVRARYIEDALLREIVQARPDIAQLRESLSGTPEEATRNERIQLGQLINDAIVQMRQLDSDDLLEKLSSHSVSSVMREPTHELDAAHIAFLVASDEHDSFREAVDEVEQGWSERVNVRLLGPMAPYDFVERQPASES